MRESDFIGNGINDFFKHHPTIAKGVRIAGDVAQIVGGGAAVVGGVGTSYTGVGGFVAVGGGILVLHGIDRLQADVRGLIDGQEHDTFTSQALQDTRGPFT